MVPSFPLLLLILATGFGGILAQTVLLRELLILFSGNEFSIGVIIGTWVIWEALGAYVGGRWRSSNAAMTEAILLATLLFALFFPAAIYAIRVFKIAIGIPPDMGVGILHVLLASFLVLLPSGLIHGFLFSLLCMLHNSVGGRDSSSAGKVYSFEMAGTILGGLSLTYLLIPHYHSLEIAALFAATSLFTSLPFIFALQTPRARVALIVFTGLFAASLLLLISGGVSRLHDYSVARQWQGKEVVHYENSLYQNIVVVKSENQYTFFSDGTPIITTPVPDIAFVEDLVHIPFLAHGRPEGILILAGGAGGVINEVLKYPTVKTVDYVEIDPALLRIMGNFATPLTLSELNDPRVRLHYADGRKFIKERGSRYDVVILGLHAPSTLQANRFFTVEFFRNLKGVLKPGGIVVFALPGSLTYYSRELREFNMSMLLTIGKVFPFRFILPGDTNLFLASPAQDFIMPTPAVLTSRLDQYKVQTNLVTLPYLEDRLQKRWQDWFSESMKGSEAAPNRDFSPAAMLYSVIYQNVLFSPFLKPLFTMVTKINVFHAALVLSLFILLFFLIRKRYIRVSIPFAIGTTGLVSMVLEMSLLFSFQVFYGYVFQEIGLLLTLFMCGITAGSLVVSIGIAEPGKARAYLKVFKTAEIAMAALPLVILAVVRFIDGAEISAGTVRLLFFILLFVTGFLTGLEFPLANEIYLRMGKPEEDKGATSLGNTVGLLYGVDLLGGWVGGFAGGLILFPVLGLSMSCVILLFLKLGSLLFLFTLPKK